MSTDQGPAEISGTIKNIVFQNRENGYSVMRTSDGRTLCGIVADVSANLREADFTATGSWKRHKTYGPQFHFEELTINESDLFYFLSRIVKGIGRKLSRHLLGLYGEERLINILNQEPTKLLQVKGIKEKKLEKITESWNRFKDLKSLSDVLIPHGASQSLLIRVYKHFIDNPDIADRIRENPYLMTEVKGIGFRTADSLARKMGIEPHSAYRIKSCVQYVLMDETSNGGNSCIGEGELFSLVKKELAYTDTEGKEHDIEEESFRSGLSELDEENKIVFLKEDDPQRRTITSTFLYRAETTILEIVLGKSRVQESQVHDNIEGFIAGKEEEMGILFSEEQKEAIRRMNGGLTFFILCGYAGTGKSTISRAMLDLLALKYGKEPIMCCALSGIASERIRKATGYHAATIQSLLVQAIREKNQLPYQVLLVDEASMVNSELFYRLFSRLRNDCLIILVGDPAQLPPIGAGNPFHDLVEAGAAPTVTLTKIYRQREDKVLSYFANFIRKGTIPPEYRDRYSDFQFVDVSIENYFSLRKTLSQKEMKALRDENAEEILAQIKRLASAFQPVMADLFKRREMADYISHFQLITPIKSGILGTENLNSLLQSIFNPELNPEGGQESGQNLLPLGGPQNLGNPLDLGRVLLHLYDRVVHIANQDMDCYDPSAFK
ncbi:MAG TPA: AAA family ATPase, partial [Spirochaetia bacterium]|nr:AAA family ATPase [Spirochaetia bacterium]